MVQSAETHIGRLFKLAGAPVIALCLVLAVWLGVHAKRPPLQDDPSAEADEAQGAAESASLTSVRLDRDDLQLASGIEIEPVQSQPIDATISCNASAGFNLNAYVKVPPKAAGILRKVNVDVGQQVRAGDVLAVVSSQDVGSLKGEYIKALVHEEHLRYQIQKLEGAIDAVAKKTLIETRHLLEEQIVDTRRIVARLEEWGFSADQITQIPKTNDLDVRLPVVAPRDGEIVERRAVEGEPVDTTEPLFAIAQLDTMWVHLNVYERDLPSIHLHQPMTFFPDGSPAEGFTGTVTWISPQVDPQTRTIQVLAAVANRDGALRANMFGKGQLVVGSGHERLVVPQAAVQSHGGDHVVFVEQADHLFELRRVVVGLKDDKFWEVTAGLKPGEKVATTGSFLLKSNLENPDFGKVE